jgi:hypothetical protein
MKTTTSVTIVKTVVLCILAMYGATLIHETGHYAVGNAVGLNVTISEIGFDHGSVDVVGDITNVGGVLTVLAGVFTLLIFGFLFIAINRFESLCVGVVFLFRTPLDLIPRADLDGGICARVITDLMLWALAVAVGFVCVVGCIHGVVRMHDVAFKH